MGRDRWNPDIEIVTDFATGAKFMRLHLDIVLDQNLSESVFGLLESGCKQEALETLLAVLPDHKPFLELFFNPPK